MIRLSDNRMIVVRPEVSRLLQQATARQLANFQMINEGEGFLWPRLDEALSIRGFLQQAKTIPDVVQVLPKPSGQPHPSRRKSAAFR